MNSSNRPLTLGLAAAATFPALSTLAGLVRPGYSPVSQYVSELAIGPLWCVQTANFVASGLLLAAFGVALAGAFGSGWRIALPATGLVLSGRAWS